MAPDLGDLTIFVFVARAGSFRQAAKANGGRKDQRLEGDYNGLTLLDGTGRAAGPGGVVAVERE